MNNKIIVSPSDSAFSYMGRIDFSDENCPVFIYAGSMVNVKFTGTSVGMMIKPMLIYEKTWIGVMLDGIQYAFEVKRNDHVQTIYIPIAEHLDEGEHTLTVFKRTAGSHHYFGFAGLMIDCGERVVTEKHIYDMNIEIFGDSVSAGEVVEAVNYTGHIDPEHCGQYDNSWFSYSLSLARKLNARLHCNAQGGIALKNGTGYFNHPDYIGMEDTYDKLSYVPEMRVTQWDFSRFTPDVVIIAIAQNDAHPNPNCIKDELYKRNWMDTYKNIVNSLREKYGEKTKFILITTVLMHEPIWDDTLDEICGELALDNVRRFRFTRNGSATPGHPRISEQEEMACELAQFINNWK